MKFELKTTQRSLPKFIRKHRRLISALSAGLAVLLLSNSLATTSSNSIPALAVPPGKTALAVQLASPILLERIQPGSVIELLAVTDGYAAVIARSVQVLEKRVGTGFGNANTELIVAVYPSEAIRVAAANQDSAIQVLLPATN